ncbi:unnamed protein product [Caenorhabditis sp. 36 PRJEB53466]|nr:unnamed protein product [Caenorhabditis sp. 36 PRJEB53466]
MDKLERDLDEEKKKRFRKRMEEFDDLRLVTNLNMDNILWPLIRGHQLPYFQPGGIWYMQDEHEPPQYWRGHWIRVTQLQIYELGGGFIDEATAQIIFARLMKSLLAYCNFMYGVCLESKKIKICRRNLDSFLFENQYIYHSYINQFMSLYPQPNVNAPKFVRLIRKLYNNDPNRKNVAKCENAFQKQISREGRTRMNVGKYAMIGLHVPYSDVTYTSPHGIFSTYYAKLFHEALGAPPMEKELIVVISWLAKRYLLEIVYMASLMCDTTGRLGEVPAIADYKRVFEYEEDLLFPFISTEKDPPIGPRAMTPPPTRPALYVAPDVSLYYLRHHGIADEQLEEQRRLQAILLNFYKIHSSNNPIRPATNICIEGPKAF